MSSVTGHLLAVLLVAAAVSTSAGAQSLPIESAAANGINHANALLREGKFDEAIEAYAQVNAADAYRDKLTYNLGVAQYHTGDIEAAKTRFAEVAASRDSSLASSSRYNLGNCYYADAVRLADQDKPAAINSLREAISHYRGSLAGNPNNTDARANIELAGEWLKRLQDEQSQPAPQESEQQESEQQQQKQQDSQSQDSSQQAQQPPQQDNESQSQDKSQDDQQNDPSQEPSSDSDSSAGEDSEPGEQASESAGEEPSSEQNDMKSAPDSPGSQEDSQQGSQSTMDGQSPTESSSGETEEVQDGSVPEGELTTATEEDVGGKSNGQIASRDSGTPDGLMTREEALKMLQAVRDRDMLRRLQQEQLERRRHIPVDRDW